MNEVLQDVAESEPGNLNSRCAGIDEDAAALIRELWTKPAKLERAGILDKYQISLTACRRLPFDRGANPYQAASKLIELRNALVHFKPEWQMAGEEHALKKQLSNLFPGSSIFAGPVHPWYPSVCLASGCAEWAHTTATELVDEWWRRMGLARDYHEDLRQMPLP